MSTYVRAIDGMSNHTAADLRAALYDFISSPGVLDLEGGHLLVEEYSTPNMSVDVNPGIAYVLNDSFTEFSSDPKFWDIIVDATVNVSISSNPSGSTRIDLICLKVDTGVSPNADASNVSTVLVVEGTPGAGQPATPSNHELLAVVTVANGETSIENADIADSRESVAFDPKTVASLIVTGMLQTNRRRATYNDIGDVGTTQDIDFADGELQTFNLDDDCTFTLSNAVAGEFLTLVGTQTSGGSHTITWPANVKCDENIAATPDDISLPTAANSEFWIGIRAVSSTAWRIVAVSGAMVN